MFETPFFSPEKWNFYKQSGVGSILSTTDNVKVFSWKIIVKNCKKNFYPDELRVMKYYNTKNLSNQCVTSKLPITFLIDVTGDSSFDANVNWCAAGVWFMIVNNVSLLYQQWITISTCQK